MAVGVLLYAAYAVAAVSVHTRLVYPFHNQTELMEPGFDAQDVERLFRVVASGAKVGRAKDADGTPLSDEAILAAADFGLFVDLSSMCQKENDRRTEVEDGLFRHSLGSLDVVYAHKSLMSLLSTRVPEGVEVDRSYGERHSSLNSQLTPLTCPSHLSKQTIVDGRTSSGRRASSSSRTASASTSASSPLRRRMRLLRRVLVVETRCGSARSRSRRSR